MSAPRPALNPYWCAHHWQPYAQLPEIAHQRINEYVPQQLWSRADFKDAVRAKLREYGQISNAPKLVVIDWTTAQRKSMCCILGDQVMERIRARIERELGLPLARAIRIR